MSYDNQLFYKQKEVVNNLTRLGHLELPKVTPILGSNEQYNYRNKMEFSFSDSRWLTIEEIQSDKDLGDKNALGFHIPGMWDKILDVKKCHLQADPSNAIRNFVKEFAIQNKLEFFNTRNQHGLLRTLMIRNTSIGEIMVLVQFFKEDQTKRELLLDALTNQFPEITSLQYVVNGKANDTIYDQTVICYSGRDHIFEEMEGLKFKINAKSFYQTNSKQAYELYKITRAFADLKGDELVYDLYTGTGTIAQFVAKQAKKVVGVEAVPVFNDTFINTHGKPDVIITDPPRDGMHKDVVAQILNILPNRIVYVSCNSATQARDLALMKEQYKIIKVQPVDMFPQTFHCENVVLLEKK